MNNSVVVSMESETLADMTRHTVLIDGERLYFEVRGPDVVAPPKTWDAAALAAVFTAMRARRALWIQGPVSRSMLGNLEEFVDAWSSWLPERYGRIGIGAATIVDDAPASSRKAAVAFSGGVDSVYTLLRHTSGAAGLRSCDPVAAVMIHGFDIPLSDEAGFRNAFNAGLGITHPLGVAQYAVTTNWRKTVSLNYAHEFAAGLAAVLQLFSSVADVALVGADSDYKGLVLPHGSNPITNPLLGGDEMAFRTVGLAANRTERIRFIAETAPDVARKLRVCWQQGAEGGNCGVCLKCVRTKLHFMVNGLEPLPFDRPPTFAEIVFAPMTKRTKLQRFRELLSEARALGIRASWVTALRIAIALNGPKIVLFDTIRRTPSLDRLVAGGRRRARPRRAKPLAVAPTAPLSPSAP